MSRYRMYRKNLKLRIGIEISYFLLRPYEALGNALAKFHSLLTYNFHRSAKYYKNWEKIKDITACIVISI